jgi:hypothetical protein
MGPLGFLTGVVLGSAVSIAVVLAMVIAIFMLSAADNPALTQEYAPLWRAVVTFTVMSVIAGAAFYSLQRRLPWRWVAQAAMWLALAVIGWMYWPTSGT